MKGIKQPGVLLVATRFAFITRSRSTVTRLRWISWSRLRSICWQSSWVRWGAAGCECVGSRWGCAVVGGLDPKSSETLQWARRAMAMVLEREKERIVWLLLRSGFRMERKKTELLFRNDCQFKKGSRLSCFAFSWSRGRRIGRRRRHYWWKIKKWMRKKVKVKRVVSRVDSM